MTDSDQPEANDAAVELYKPAGLIRSKLAPPAIVEHAGSNASFAWDEFFSGMIANRYTRRAYLQAVRRFLSWAEARNLLLPSISPGDVGCYFVEFGASPPTHKLHLAALRGFFDVLVNRHVCLLNPAATVRSQRHSVSEGKTPAIVPEQVRLLLGSIDVTSAVGLRDRAIIGCLIYTAARAGAIASLRIGDMVWDGSQYTLRFREKNGRHNVVPVRHDLQLMLDDYRAALPIEGRNSDSPLFRTAFGRTGELNSQPVSNIDVSRMVKRRLRDAGLPLIFSPHSFRVCAITSLLESGAPMEDVQYLAGHADPRTTRLYDRRQRQVTRNLVERIGV